MQEGRPTGDRLGNEPMVTVRVPEAPGVPSRLKELDFSQKRKKDPPRKYAESLMVTS